MLRILWMMLEPILSIQVLVFISMTFPNENRPTEASRLSVGGRVSPFQRLQNLRVALANLVFLDEDRESAVPAILERFAIGTVGDISLALRLPPDLPVGLGIGVGYENFVVSALGVDLVEGHCSLSFP